MKYDTRQTAKLLLENLAAQARTAPGHRVKISAYDRVVLTWAPPLTVDGEFWYVTENRQFHLEPKKHHRRQNHGYAGES